MLHPSRACWLIFAAILSNPVAAQEYPVKPIRVIITGGAGGSTDVIAHAFVKEGASTIFGLLGDGQLTWWAEMAGQPGVKLVDVRDEGAAVAMADGSTFVPALTACGTR